MSDLSNDNTYAHWRQTRNKTKKKIGRRMQIFILKSDKRENTCNQRFLANETNRILKNKKSTSISFYKTRKYIRLFSFYVRRCKKTNFGKSFFVIGFRDFTKKDIKKFQNAISDSIGLFKSNFVTFLFLQTLFHSHTMINKRTVENNTQI